MQFRNVPTIGPRYWAALCLASVFGANMGDFVSHNLHLGHANGLFPLLLAFLGVVAAERLTGFTTEAWYWVAIVILRTAATNLGDLLTHDFRIPYPFAVAGLAVLLLSILLAEPRSASTSSGLPATSVFYWLAMLTAGTLGTAGGDYVAGDLGLGVGLGTIVLSAVLAASLITRAMTGLIARWSYWLTVVAVRSAGTTAGDYCAGRHGLALGLPLSTSLFGMAFLVLLVAWRSHARAPATAI